MISIRKLQKHYGKVHAVDGLSLEIPKGELFCFLGPNGAGKTTTIKILTGLVKADAGDALVNDIDVTVDPLAAKAVMGYIPDMPYIYERLTVTEFTDFVAELYGIDKKQRRERSRTLFEIFGLVPHQSKLVRELSHGLRQRLIYTATLIHDPEVLFIDEPLIGLDPATIRTIKDLLRQRARNGTTIFLTTHILALAEDIADRIGIINHGQLQALGTPQELCEQTSQSTLEDAFLLLTEETQQ